MIKITSAARNCRIYLHDAERFCNTHDIDCYIKSVSAFSDEDFVMLIPNTAISSIKFQELKESFGEFLKIETGVEV